MQLVHEITYCNDPVQSKMSKLQILLNIADAERGAVNVKLHQKLKQNMPTSADLNDSESHMNACRHVVEASNFKPWHHIEGRMHTLSLPSKS
jgi:hypothetical protein